MIPHIKVIRSGPSITVLYKGGPGSGNFGHKGRPGEVGGSGEGGEPSLLNIPETERMSLKVSGGETRIFISAYLKNPDWLEAAFLNGRPVVDATIDLNPTTRHAYMNRIDSAQSGKGYAREVLRRALEHLRGLGYKTASGYVEAENIQSQNMMTKLGFTQGKTTRDGSIWDLNLSNL